MSDMMTFPATVEEFMEQYKIVDDEKVYTNGADLVPIFRMMQWFEHVSATDTISRQAAIMDAESWVAVDEYEKNLQKKVVEWLKEFQPAELGTNLAEVGTDCISRQAAIDAVKKLSLGETDTTRLAMRIGDYLERLPSAQPKKIRGQWSIKGQAIDTVRGYWAKCSACGHSVFGGGNYCSNCGSYNKGEVTT